MKTIWTVLVAALVTLSLASTATASEDKVEDYGVSSVEPCPTIDHPPSAAEAAQLLTCSQSYDDFGHGTVYRTFNVKVQVGKPRAYAVGDPGGNDIDPSAPVYPIRGSQTDAVCSPISDYMKNAGKNCAEFDQTTDGRCFQTPFGDWKCTWSLMRAATRFNVPARR